jgi:hypothetical protein
LTGPVSSLSRSDFLHRLALECSERWAWRAHVDGFDGEDITAKGCSNDGVMNKRMGGVRMV